MNLGDKDKKFVVYCHTNKINNKKYIGITCQELNQRFRNGKGYKSSKHFNHAIQKYGWDSFEHEILFEDLTIEEAKEKEIELIEQLKTRDKRYGYNMTPGGEGYCGEDHPMFGTHPSLETRKKMSESSKGRHLTDEWKKKISLSNKGKPKSEEAKAKMRGKRPQISGENHPFYGRKLTQEQIDRLVKASKTPEAIAKMKKNKVWYSGKDNPHAKRVRCVETGIIYDTMKEAAEDNNCIPSKVSSVCNGSRNHTNNLHFEFVDDKDIETVKAKKARNIHG